MLHKLTSTQADARCWCSFAVSAPNIPWFLVHLLSTPAARSCERNSLPYCVPRTTDTYKAFKRFVEHRHKHLEVHLTDGILVDLIQFANLTKIAGTFCCWCKADNKIAVKTESILPQNVALCRRTSSCTVQSAVLLAGLYGRFSRRSISLERRTCPKTVP
jgi:hypothetical protein